MWVVTIDGPAGAGKSTVARCLAERLQCRLLDTGAMYRAVALAAIRAGTTLADDNALGELAGRLQVAFRDDRVLLDGEDVSREIRTSEVTRTTRFAADSPSVRRHLVGWQREFARTNGPVVAEGRDQGTIVFPSALLKFFLSASDEERARRRHAEITARGETADLDQVLQDVRARDAQDQARAIAPMIPAPGAEIIDSTGMETAQVVSLLEHKVRAALLNPAAGSDPA